MIPPSFIAVLFFSSFVAANVLPRAPFERCATVVSPERIAKAENRFASLKTLNKLSTARNVTVPVVFHVITQDDTLEGGNIPDAQITAQMNVLNADYAKTGLSFNLVNTTRTRNESWFNNLGPDSFQDADAKGALRVGGPETLNIYTVGFGDSQLLGYATFPDEYADAPKLDGVVILYSSLPGGTKVPFDLGRTLTHEAGHWVGLYHTFQDGCSSGDLVDDTAPENDPAFGCPVGRDTCTGDSLPDPIHNFMDYTGDSCMTEFTPGQATRLLDQIAVYRKV